MSEENIGPEIDAAAPNSRQQDKIIAVMMRGDRQLVERPRVELQSGERERFLREVAAGKIGPEQFDQFVRDNIQPPLDLEPNRAQPDGLFGRISGNRQMLGMVAELSGKGFSQRETIASGDLGAFLQRYPTPAALEAAPEVQKFLAGIAQHNGDAKRREYETTLQNLMRTLYGKQYEYHRQAQLLQAEARRSAEEDTADLEVTADRIDQGELEPAVDDAIAEDLGGVALEASVNDQGGPLSAPDAEATIEQTPVPRAESAPQPEPEVVTPPPTPNRSSSPPAAEAGERQGNVDWANVFSSPESLKQALDGRMENLSGSDRARLHQFVDMWKETQLDAKARQLWREVVVPAFANIDENLNEMTSAIRGAETSLAAFKAGIAEAQGEATSYAPGQTARLLGASRRTTAAYTGVRTSLDTLVAKQIDNTLASSVRQLRSEDVAAVVRQRGELTDAQLAQLTSDEIPNRLANGQSLDSLISTLQQQLDVNPQRRWTYVQTEGIEPVVREVEQIIGIDWATQRTAVTVADAQVASLVIQSGGFVGVNPDVLPQIAASVVSIESSVNTLLERATLTRARISQATTAAERGA